MSAPFYLPSLQRALGDRYLVQRLLGRGGMGVVYLALEPRLDRHVALKLLPPSRAADPVARGRFLQEARTAAHLSHPNIVPIFAVDEVGEFVFFVMAYVAGETLGDRVRERGRLEPREGAPLLRSVAQALAYAHACGVVHRDVKPDNILLEAATGRAFVTDFGIARGSSAKVITGPQRVVGTAEFMSPEQARGEPATPRSDIYSLGIVAYYTLSGRLPFTGPDDVAVLAQHATDPAPPLSSVAPWLPHRLGEIVDRCLAKDPLDRPADGYAVADALAAAGRSSETLPVGLRAFLRLPLPVTLMRVRRLLAAGHDRAELVEALRAELERRQEELAFVYGRGPGAVERALRKLTLAALAIGAGAVAAAEWWPPVVGFGDLWMLAAGAAGAALLAALGARSRAELREDPVMARRLRFWRGRLGRLVFRLAGLWPPRGAHALQPSPSLD